MMKLGVIMTNDEEIIFIAIKAAFETGRLYERAPEKLKETKNDLIFEIFNRALEQQKERIFSKRSRKK